MKDLHIKILAIAIPLALALALLANVPSVDANPINVFEVGSYQKTVNAGTEVEFDWVVFNNETSPVLVTPRSTSVNADLAMRFDPAFATLDPGSSATIRFIVDTDPNMGYSNLTLDVVFSATPMSDPAVVWEESRSANLIVESRLANVGNNAIFGIWPNQLPPPLDSNWGAFLVTFVGWALIGLAFVFVVDPIVHYITRKTDTILDDMILKIIRVPVFVFIITYGAVTSLEILNIDRDIVAQIETAYEVVVVLLVVWVAYKVYKEVVLYYAKEYAKKTDTQMDDVAVPLLEKIGLIVIPLAGLMVILSMFGYDLTALLAAAGFLGIVIGFAAQSTLANFFAGLQLIADRPFKVGDILRLEDGDQLEVRHIGMRATELYNPDTDETVVIPNNEIANRRIVNMVEPDRKLRIIVTVGVAYGSDVEKVMTIMRQTAMDLPNTLKGGEHMPVVRFYEFGESSLNFKIFIWVDDVNNRFKVSSDFRQELNRRFAEAGIEIPYPQRVITIKHDKEEKGELQSKESPNRVA